MTGGFPVGTVCIGQNFINDTDCNGAECVVISPLQLTGGIDSKGEYSAPKPRYCVQFAHGRELWVTAFHLRRKQPPTGLATVLAWFTAPAPREVEAA